MNFRTVRVRTVLVYKAVQTTTVVGFSHVCHEGFKMQRPWVEVLSVEKSLWFHQMHIKRRNYFKVALTFLKESSQIS